MFFISVFFYLCEQPVFTPRLRSLDGMFSVIYLTHPILPNEDDLKKEVDRTAHGTKSVLKIVEVM